MASPASRIEEVQVSGPELVAAIKDLVRQGKARRISIRNQKGVTLLEIPFIVGVAGAVLAPVWAAIGALAALVGKCTLVIERIEEATQPPRTPVQRDTPPRSRSSKKPPAA